MKIQYLTFRHEATSTQRKLVVDCFQDISNHTFNDRRYYIALRKYINAYEARTAYLFRQRHGYWPFFFDIHEAIALDPQMKTYLKIHAVTYRDAIKEGNQEVADLSKCAILSIHQFMTLERNNHEQA